jgi:hypothetical protein
MLQKESFPPNLREYIRLQLSLQLELYLDKDPILLMLLLQQTMLSAKPSIFLLGHE